MKTYREFKEDIGNTAGSGAIAGIGVGPQGEPGIDVSDDNELASRSLASKTPIWPMMKRRKPEEMAEDLFAGAEIFDVSHDIFAKCRLGKVRYHRWSKYVGDDAIGQKIRAYGIANPNKSIVIRDKRSGAMMFLRHAALPSFAAFCMS